MDDKKLIRTLKTISIKNGLSLNNGTAIYINRKLYCPKHKNSPNTWRDEFIVLIENNVRVGGVYIMGDVDLHFVIFKKYRNKGYLSKFMKSGVLQKMFPKLLESSICNFEEEKKIKHLLQLANIKIK
jgi:hypothetical protein